MTFKEIDLAIAEYLERLEVRDPEALRVFNFSVPTFVRAKLLKMCLKLGCANHKEVLFILQVYHILIRNFNVRWYYPDEKIECPAYKIFTSQGKFKVDISYNFIRRLCGKNFSLTNRECLNLIGFDNSDSYKKKCRKFYFKPEVFKELMLLVIQSLVYKLKKKSSVQFVDLYSGSKMNTQYFHKLDKDIEFIVPNNWYKLQKKTEQMNFEVSTFTSIIEEMIDRVNSIGVTSKDLRLFRSLCSILSRAKYEDDKVIYKPKYRMGSTGRSYEIGGGFQGLAKEFKQRLSQDFECYNYDFKSMHMFNLYMASKEMSVTGAWYAKFITGKLDKALNKIGLPKDKLKPCLYGISMGSPLKPYVSTKDESIVSKIFSSIKYTKEQYYEFYSLVYTVKLNFEKMCKKILTGKYYTTLYEGAVCFKNSFGVILTTLSVKDGYLHIKKAGEWVKLTKREQNKKLKFLISFITQGHEQSLVLASSSFLVGVKLFSLEHDGFLSNLRLPERKVRLACNKVFNFPLSLAPKLVVKPFWEAA